MSQFDDATQVAADGTADIHDGWDINGNANGGYLLALAANGLRAGVGRPDPITVSAHFLTPGTPGPVTIGGEVIRAGRRLATVSGSMRRDGRPMLQVLATFGDLRHGDGPERVAAGPPALEPFDSCVPRSTVFAQVAEGLMTKVDVRLRARDVGFVDGRPTGAGEMAGWFAFRDGRPIDTLALLLVCDSFPPAVFNLDVAPNWVPTIELTVHVRGIPAPGPLRCIFRTRVVHGGFLEEDGEVWDSDGRLVAMSRQLALTPR